MLPRFCGPSVAGESMQPSRWIKSGDLFDAMETEARRAFAILRAEGKERGNTGGVGCVLKTDRPHDLATSTLLQPLIGDVHDADLVRYRSFAQEKAFRLMSRPGDVSSFQSRDEAKERWGGAVRAGTYILSFSGLPELMDEAVMLATAVRLGLIDRTEAVRIAALSGNPYFVRFV